MNSSSQKNRIRLGDISVNFLQSIIKSIKQEGKNPEPLLTHYRITEALLNTPSARISIPKFMRIGHDAIQLTNNPALGLILGQNMHIGDIGLAGLTAATAKNLDRALSTLIRFELLSSKNSRGRSHYYNEEELSICQFYSISPYNQYNYFVVDTTLSSWFSFSKWVSGNENIIQQIEVEYPDIGYRQEMENYFKCPVQYNQARNAIIFKKGATQQASLYANQATFQQAVNTCERELNKITSNTSTKERTIELIGPMLNGTAPTIEQIAQKMGIASWTLRRNLKKEDTNYNELLNQTRKELAESYVRDTNLNFTETAFLLGFSSPAAFQRSFKRWMNVSPGEYRRNAVSSN
jgi:AraC-like DNA-binding protein